jgi:hypothetical protein
MAARIPQKLAIERTRDGHFTFRTAADTANVAADARAKAFRLPLLTDSAGHFPSIRRQGRRGMSRTNLFFKVEVEHDREDDPRRLGEEITRQLRKMYGVRDVELSNFAVIEE